MEEEKHNSLLEAARSKEAPNILLNVEVMEAKELRPKDANGNLFVSFNLFTFFVILR